MKHDLFIWQTMASSMAGTWDFLAVEAEKVDPALALIMREARDVLRRIAKHVEVRSEGR